MLDPFPAPPPALVRLVTPLAELLSLPTLPLHAHEIVFAALAYQAIASFVSPALSSRLFPRTYGALPYRTRVNWDVHVVSLVQSVLVNGLALWVIAMDDERRAMDWPARVWGYTGASGLVQGLAAGYFLWDLSITVRHVDIFGWGMLVHAICALCVFACGFRPFVNYYGPIFILYELSSPFLNIHWFFDKLGMTGSKPQLYNGIVLLGTFFGCRIVWGTVQTSFVFWDVWRAVHHQLPSSPSPVSYAQSSTSLPANVSVAATQEFDYGGDHAEIMRFAGPHVVPMWLAMTYLTANILLTSLNLYWFNKMVEAVRKRFRAPSAEQQESREKAGAAGQQARAETGAGHAQETTAKQAEDRHTRDVLSSTTAPLDEMLRDSTTENLYGRGSGSGGGGTATGIPSSATTKRRHG